MHPKLSPTPEDDRSFRPAEIEEAKAYYLENGYVVFREAIRAGACDRVTASFQRDIKPYGGPIRRIDGSFEPNRMNGHGHLVNPIMNIQGAPAGLFDSYVADTLGVLTDGNIREFLRTLLGAELRLFTTNHFEANPETVPHHDCYFWGRLEVGQVIGAWVALEDIAPGAGPLFVYPGSHRLDIEDFAKAQGQRLRNPNPSDADYRNLVVRFLEEGSLARKAPILRKGDLLFWDSRTIHGSLKTTDPTRSRSSFTAHYCAAPFSLIDRSIPIAECNGFQVAYPPWPREGRDLRLRIRARFPAAWQLARRVVRKLRSLR